MPAANRRLQRPAARVANHERLPAAAEARDVSQSREESLETSG